MDISARPALIKISDFSSIDYKISNFHTPSDAERERLSTVPLGPLTTQSDIFICSVTCGDSANAFIREITPRLHSGEGILFANFIRNDNDLNVWTRIFKLKWIYRAEAVNQIYQAAYKNKINNTKEIHSFLDDYLSNIPLERVNSSFDINIAAISGLMTTVVLRENYHVSTTPVTTRLK